MNLVYWVWLQQALGYGSRYVSSVLESFGSAENIYKSNRTEYISKGIKSKNVLDRLSDKSLDTATKILDSCNENGIEILPFVSQKFPNELRQITIPPTLLYAKGDSSLLLDETKICIVGPRDVSAYGKKAAFSLAGRLALCGFTVVSGGALGCDTAAHKGALSVNGKTICFLGSGICSEYLNKNKSLRDEISEKGLLLSEYPPYFSATKYTFPMRNRLMAGITLGTAVIEAAEKSGTLITANAAAEAGKDVFVIPGNPTLSNYKGSNKLLRDGAKPLLELSDIITEYLHLYPHKIKPEKAYSQKLSMKSEKTPAIKQQIVEKTDKIKKNIQENLSNNAKVVYNYLDKQIFYYDELSCLSLTNSQLLAALTELEIFGYIEALPGGRYSILE